MMWIIAALILGCAYALYRVPLQPTKPRVYLAGPMTGLPQFGFPAFDAAAKMLRERGYDVVSPADISRSFDATPETVDDLLPAIMGEDLRLLCTCESICMLPGWLNSPGARIEYDIAVYLGLSVLGKIEVSA